MRVHRWITLLSCFAAVAPAGVTGQTAQQEVRNRLGVSGRADTTTALALSAAFRAAAERTLPAVVFISVEQKAQTAVRPDQVPPQLREFFGGRDGQQPPQLGTGSGFIIDVRGHIITNNHVVADASHLSVRLVDGREYNARVIGADISTDIAIIKIDPRAGETLPVAPLGESDSLRVGDWVLALGNPLGLDFSVTAGIVSAKGRQISSAESLESFIQTDAAINPGNSGGPLIDLFGRVIGVNSAIFGSTRFVGYGFAVPINLARRVVDDLLAFGYLRRPRVGISVGPVQAVDAEIAKLKDVRGAFISAVEPGGPGAQAGLVAGDVALSVNNRPIRTDAELITGLAGMRPGEKVTVGISRDGSPRNVVITLGEFPRPAQPVPPAAPPAAPKHEQVLGFSVGAITPRVADINRYGGQDGVAITALPQFGSAYNANIRTDMVLLAINGQTVNSAADVSRIAETITSGSAVSLRLFHPTFKVIVINYRTRQ